MCDTHKHDNLSVCGNHLILWFTIEAILLALNDSSAQQGVSFQK